MSISNISNSHSFNPPLDIGKNKTPKKVINTDTKKTNKKLPLKPFSNNHKFKTIFQNNSRDQFGIQTEIGKKSVPGDFKISNFKFEGKPISNISTDDARELVSKNGHFGAEKTGHRIASSAISLAGDDIEKLKVTKEATIAGFKEAESAVGGKLFQISYDTLDIALKEIDDKLRELTGSVVDFTA